MQARVANYLDANSGAPLRPEVVEALRFFLNDSGRASNPSSIHLHGRLAKRYLSEAREQVALSLGNKTDSEQIILTSSGTEANQLAIQSVLGPRFARREKVHWITTPVEHDSNLQMIKWVEERGGSVSLLPVDPNGVPRPEALVDLWQSSTALVSVVWVNNETGVISDLATLIREVRARDGILHVDAAQAWGKIPINVDEMGAHLVSVSAHKIGGLAGAGALWVKRGVPIHSVIRGKQEKGRRGGSENLIGSIAMGSAAQTFSGERWAFRASQMDRVRLLRDRLESVISKRIPGTVVNGQSGGQSEGQPAQRVANTSNLSFEGVEGDGLVMALDLAGYSVSAGSACSSGTLEPSHVLVAMGKTKLQAMAAIRISLAEEVPWEALEGFIEQLEMIIARLRRSR